MTAAIRLLGSGARAIGLHMHRPLIPAGGQDLRRAPLIGNQYMFEHPDIGENHNAAVFRWCYRRMGELIPELVGRVRDRPHQLTLKPNKTVLTDLAGGVASVSASPQPSAGTFFRLQHSAGVYET